MPGHGRTTTSGLMSVPEVQRKCVAGVRTTASGTKRTCRLCRAMSASLIGHLGSSAFRLSTTTVSMSLTGSCFSSESAPRPLYGVFFVKEFAMAAKLSFVGFLVRSQSLFLRPDLRIADVDARRICTRLAVTPTLRHASPLPGHTLTASSTTARNAVAMTIRGEPAFGRGSVAPQPCIR